ncbi:hypothetical protein ACLKA7_015026 [Drosophila subpalustris]
MSKGRRGSNNMRRHVLAKTEPEPRVQGSTTTAGTRPDPACGRRRSAELGTGNWGAGLTEAQQQPQAKIQLQPAAI